MLSNIGPVGGIFRGYLWCGFLCVCVCGYTWELLGVLAGERVVSRLDTRHTRENWFMVNLRDCALGAFEAGSKLYG